MPQEFQRDLGLPEVWLIRPGYDGETNISNYVRIEGFSITEDGMAPKMLVFDLYPERENQSIGIRENGCPAEFVPKPGDWIIVRQGSGGRTGLGRITHEVFRGTVGTVTSSLEGSMLHIKHIRAIDDGGAVEAVRRQFEGVHGVRVNLDRALFEQALNDRLRMEPGQIERVDRLLGSPSSKSVERKRKKAFKIEAAEKRRRIRREDL